MRFELFSRLGQLPSRAVEDARARGPYGRLPPGPPEPATIQTLEWIKAPIRYLRRHRARYGTTFTMRILGGPPFVTFSDPDAIKEVFTGSPDDLHAGQANVVLEPILGADSVLLLDGARHLRQRRLLLPPFHGQRMRTYGSVIRDVTLEAIASWPRNEPFALHERTQAITMDIILRTVFGLDEGPKLTELRAALTELLDGVSNPLFLFPFFRVDRGRFSPGHYMFKRLERVDRLLHAVIRDRQREGRGDREDVLAMLVEARDENGEAMSAAELRDELMTLLVAGHETTATTLAWAAYRLLRHPDALARTERELDAHFDGGDIDPDRVQEIAWLAAVAKETLRLNPVVPAVGRGLQRPMRIGGYDLPVGVLAVPNIYLTHRNPAAWPDPDRFDPSRFMGQKISPYAFLPFGGGVRRCIGMAFALYEIEVVLATMLSKLRIERAPGYRPKLVRRAITFAPSEGMPIVVRDRHASPRHGAQKAR